MDRKGDTQSSASWEAFEDVVSQYHNIISYVNEFIQNALPRFLNSRTWLLPLELHIIALIFQIQINFYTKQQHLCVLISELNPIFGSSPHCVCFDGFGHYERVILVDPSSSKTPQSYRPSSPEFMTHQISSGGSTHSSSVEDIDPLPRKRNSPIEPDRSNFVTIDPYFEQDTSGSCSEETEDVLTQKVKYLLEPAVISDLIINAVCGCTTPCSLQWSFFTVYYS
jgi:hypothetical protein